MLTTFWTPQFLLPRKTLIWLNDIREYLEGYVTANSDYARRSMAVANALCLICSRRFPQLTLANKTLNVEPVKMPDLIWSG